MSWNEYPEYVPVAKRRENAAREMDKLRKKGRTITPIEIQGLKIAKTFWGKAWCDHIEQLADFESRLGKGKTYVRNGSVCHLAITAGKVEAIVSGSEMYEISVEIQPLSATRWKQIKQRCAGQIGTAIELLQGKLSDEVMRVLTDPDEGMFPHVDDFDLDCGCPDFVRLCKHLAAVLYGVGARLDAQPELLFTLRGVDPAELLDHAIDSDAIVPTSTSQNAIAESDLGDIFGINVAASPSSTSTTPSVSVPARKKPARRGTASKPSRKKKATKPATTAKPKAPAKRSAKRQ